MAYNSDKFRAGRGRAERRSGDRFGDRNFDNRKKHPFISGPWDGEEEFEPKRNRFEAGEDRRERSFGGARNERGDRRGERTERNNRFERGGYDNRESRDNRGYRRERSFERDRDERRFERDERRGGFDDRSERRGFRSRQERGGFDREDRGERRGERRFDRGRNNDRRDRNDRRGFNADRGYSKSFAKKRQTEQNYNEGRHQENAQKKQEGFIRLNRYIANAGICSRREADEMISSGVIKVNGEVCTVLGTMVGPGDKVQFGGQTLKAEKKVYIAMNKPKGYITTLEDPEERRTVMDLLEGACKERIYPVGRLDRNTTGVLLFTNDGEMAKILTHPSHGARKIYHVTLDKAVTKADLQTMMKGVKLEDGLVQVDEADYVEGAGHKEVGVQLHSGKNRIVRRIFEHLGYEVVKLDRVLFAEITKKDMSRGQWRFLTEKEIGFLRMNTGQDNNAKAYGVSKRKMSELTQDMLDEVEAIAQADAKMEAEKKNVKTAKKTKVAKAAKEDPVWFEPIAEEPVKEEQPKRGRKKKEEAVEEEKPKAKKTAAKKTDAAAKKKTTTAKKTATSKTTAKKTAAKTTAAKKTAATKKATTAKKTTEAKTKKTTAVKTTAKKSATTEKATTTAKKAATAAQKTTEAKKAAATKTTTAKKATVKKAATATKKAATTKKTTTAKKTATRKKA